MDFVRRLVRRTPLRGLLHWYRDRRQARQWTPHDDEMVRFYSQFVAPGDVCFDVGANVGNRTRVFLALGATVVAVRTAGGMSADIASCLRRQFAVDDCALCARGRGRRGRTDADKQQHHCLTFPYLD